MNFNGILLTSDVGANQDLFAKAWTEGNLYQISGFVSALGSFCCTMISIVGFGIVIFSILKNAMSGLYVVNPTFWDKVDDIKTAAKDGVSNATSGGNVAVQRVGSVLTFLLGLVPNIKALTDFDEETPDKKQYFMKSIPLLIAQIFIGMLIFFGYPAKIAQWIGNGATYAVSAILANVDPVEIVTGISDNFTIYTLSTDGSQLPVEQTINKMTTEMISVVKTRYKAIEKQPMQETATEIESKLINAFQVTDGSVIADVLGATEGYDISISASAQSSAPTVSSSYQAQTNGVYVATATNGTRSFKYWIQAAELPMGVPNVNPEDYLVWQITATPVAITHTSAANLYVCGGIQTGGTSNRSYTTFGIDLIKFGTGESDVHGALGKTVTVEIISRNNGSITVDGETVTFTKGDTVKVLTGTIVSNSVTTTAGQSAMLQFSKVDGDTVKNLLTQDVYVRVTLPSGYTYGISQANKSTVTLNVSELRLEKSASGVTGLLSSWADVNSKYSHGTTLNYSILDKTSSGLKFE